MCWIGMHSFWRTNSVGSSVPTGHLFPVESCVVIPSSCSNSHFARYVCVVYRVVHSSFAHSVEFPSVTSSPAISLALLSSFLISLITVCNNNKLASLVLSLPCVYNSHEFPPHEDWSPCSLGYKGTQVCFPSSLGRTLYIDEFVQCLPSKCSIWDQDLGKWGKRTAKASGLTPFSIIETQRERVERSRCVFYIQKSTSFF